ncbi:putative hydroxyproline dehydratase [Hyaloraphidium curvatum]|nr:putative hydroxyproline dehydratase [Hyaloraphidium curvatum]
MATRLPFEGLLVIDATQYAAGPSTSTVLAEWGAEVIKVEPTEGDNFRNISRPGDPPFIFDFEGKGRRSVALNLRHKGALSAFFRLVERADVLVTNTPLAARERLGIDAATMLARNPRLIYASLTGYGETGPDRHKPGFDATAWWAASGMQDVVKPHPDAPPSLAVGAMGDHATAMSMVAAISAGLYARSVDGRGRVVGTNLFHNGVWSNGTALQGRFDGATEQPIRPRTEAPYPTLNTYRCRCGRWLQLVVLAPDIFGPLFEALGDPGLAADPRIATHEGRLANSAEIIRILDARFAEFDRDEIAARFDAARVPYGLIATLSDAAGSAHAREAGIYGPYADGTGLTVTSPLDFPGARRRALERAPGLGQHTEEVLRWLGLGDEEIAGMEAEGGITRGKPRASL